MTTAKENRVRSWPIWRYIYKLATYKLNYYLASGIMASNMFYIFPLIPGLVVRQILDALTEQRVGFNLWTMVALFFGIWVARQAFLMGAVFAENSLHIIVNTLLRKNLLQHILNQPGARALPHSPGEAISRFRDDVEALPDFLSWTMDPIGQATVMIVGLSVLARINARITLFVIIPIIITLILANMASKRIRRYREANQKAIGAVTDFLGETFGAVMALKIAGTEKHVIKHFDTLNEKRRKANLADLIFRQLLESFTYNSANLGTGLLLIVVANAIQTDAASALSIGDFSLFISYLGWMTFVTSMFGSYLVRYQQTGVSVRRLMELLPESKPETLVEHGPIYLRGEFPELPYTAHSAIEPLEQLEARGLRYHYPDSTHGIEGIDLAFPRGSFTVITGRIGSGKTTLLRALLGLLPKEGGEIRWNGAPVEDPATFFTPPRTAYTPQVPRLFSESLRDNILMGLPGEEFDIDHALYQAVMEKDLEDLDQGYETLVGPRGVRLSGGQVQRTSAARMFVRRPEVLVFDDLSSALDVDTERLLWERVFEQQGQTCLVVSHRRAALRRADQIILMDEGRVATQGTLEELLTNSALFRELWEGDEGKKEG